MKILIVDAYNMIHRARYGFAHGSHAVTYNFFRSLKSEITRHNVDRVYIVSEGRPIHRLKLNSEYKGQRVPIKDEGFHRQKRTILELCKYLPVTFMRHVDYECDDVIAHICRNLEDNEEAVIISSDSDFIQLLDQDNVKLWNPVRKKFIERWPVDYVTWKSLKGDPTDNVPGIKGVGEKRASALCADPQTLTEFLSAEPDRHRVFELAKAQIQLAAIPEDADGWEISLCRFNENYVKKAFTEFGFKSIIEKSWFKWKTCMEELDDRYKTTSLEVSAN